MAHRTTPHTQSGQNQGFEESDREGRLSDEPVARGEDAIPSDVEGAQTGTNRGSVHAPGMGPSHHGSHPIENVLEGSLASRTPGGDGQGITNQGHAKENAGQEKVVDGRPDAQSGVNQALADE